jgi:membrane-associated phospholipid phosphatase
MDVDVARVVELRTGSGAELDRNPTSALPSLHAGIPMLYAAWFWGFARGDRLRWLAPALFLWGIGMGWSVVHLGEHYALDVLAGFLLVAPVTLVLARAGLLHKRGGRVERFTPAPSIAAQAA